MIDKELHKLKRGDLLELLLEQSKAIDDLKMQLREKEEIIVSLNKKLEERKIDIQKAGSIAEASFKLNGVFEAAEKAAQQYLENVKDLHDGGQNIVPIKEVIENRYRPKVKKAETKYTYLDAEAKEVAEQRWNELSTKLDAFYIKYIREQKHFWP